MTLRYCCSCKRLVGCGPDVRFCPCGKSWDGRRCLGCLSLSDASAVACMVCGKHDALSEPTRSFNLTGLARISALGAALSLLREGLAHLPLLAGWGVRGLAVLFSTTPDTLLLPLVGALKILPLALLLSFLLSGGTRIREWMWSACVVLGRLALVSGRAAFHLTLYLTNGPKPPRDKKNKK